MADLVENGFTNQQGGYNLGGGGVGGGGRKEKMRCSGLEGDIVSGIVTGLM